MGSIGTAEIMIVLVAALLILGPKKLPDAARQVGKAVSEFRRMANGFQNDMKHAFTEEEAPSYQPPLHQPALPQPLSYEAPYATPAPEDGGAPIVDPFHPGIETDSVESSESESESAPLDATEPVPFGMASNEATSPPAEGTLETASPVSAPVPPDDSSRT